MKIGLLFAGQGAQYPGMGRSLYECSAAARKVFDLAGEDIKDRCFNGTKETLRQTQVTQPCVYVVAMAAYEALLEMTDGKLSPAGVAGFSLGEYSALTAAGVIEDVKKGLEIVRLRGELMLQAGKGDGGMIAAFGKRQEILNCVEAAREDGILAGANFNTPIQTVVAGDMDALTRFSKKAAENKIKVVALSVSAAFHTSMMEQAAEPLRRMLLGAGLKKPKLKVYCNVTGGELGEDVVGTMAKQVRSPVLWQETIENMTGDGIDMFVELGPGATLSGMVRKIAHGTAVLNVEDEKSLKKAAETLSGVCDGRGDR